MYYLILFFIDLHCVAASNQVTMNEHKLVKIYVPCRRMNEVIEQLNGRAVGDGLH